MSRLYRSSVNMAASATGYVIPLLVTLIATPLLLKWLGVASFGLQSLVAVIIGYFTLMDLGLDLPIMKLLSETRAKNDLQGENRMLSTTLQLYGLIGVAGMLSIMLASAWLPRAVFRVPSDLLPEATLVFRLAGLGFLGSVLTSWGKAVAAGLQRFEIIGFVSCISSVVGVGLGLIVVMLGFGVVGYVLVRVVVSLLTGPAHWMAARRFLPTFEFKWGIDRNALGRVSSYVGYGAVNRIVGSVVGRLDQTLIGIWLGVAAAGVYSVPYLMVTSLGYMAANTLGFLFPMASELQSLGRMDQLRNVFVRATRFVSAVAGMAFVLLFVFADKVLTLWVPTIAVQATPVLRLLTAAVYITTLCSALTNNVLVGIGHMREYTIYAIIRGAVLGALCLLFIRPLGLKGAGWALLLTGIVDLVYLIVVSSKYLQLSPKLLFVSAYLKPMALTAILGLFAFLAQPTIVSWLSLALVTTALSAGYVLIGFTTDVFGETEKRALAGLWRLAARRVAES